MRFVLLLIIPFMLIAGCGWSSPPNQHTASQKVKEILSQPPFSNKEYRQAITVLTEAIDKQPNNTDLILLRARYYAEIGNYKRARKDISSVIATGINYPDLVMFKCMLIERINGFTERARSCYVKVMDKYANQLQTHAKPSVNYVISAFLAKSGEAEALKRRYLNNTPQSNPMYSLIENFNRETYINTVLP